jgi:hypothetical protein
MRAFFLAMAPLAMLLCVTLVPARATQVIPRTAPELGDEASLVVRGRVEQVRSFWSPNHTKILTEILVKVEEDYKGQAPGQVRILQLGGVVDGVRVTVSGALHWQSKEEVLLFLEPYTADSYQVSGFSQGKFSVQRDEKTGEAYVSRRALEGIEWVPSNSAKTDSSPKPVEQLSLDRFLDEALGQKQEGGAR